MESRPRLSSPTGSRSGKVGGGEGDPGEKRKARRRSSSSSSSGERRRSRKRSRRDSSSGERKKGRRKEKKREKKKSKKKEKKESKKEKRPSREEKGPEPKVERKEGEEAGDTAPRNMRPMTKEEWEARQSVIRREVSPTTGRTRLIRGEGEVIEEIVSRDRHREINRAATRGNATTFQATIQQHVRGGEKKKFL